MSRAHLDDVAAEAGFRVARFRYYTPLLSSIAENILVPVAAHAMARKAARRTAGSATVDRGAMRTARLAAKERIAKKGMAYRALQALTRVIMLDVALFGRMRSGPFFALLVKRSG